MKKNGFSLIEVIVSVAILTVLSGVFIDIYLRNQKNYKYQQNLNVLQTSTRSSLDAINTWIKRTSAVVPSYTAPDNTVYTTSAHTLVLKVLSINGSGNTIADTYDYIIFKADSGNSKLLKEILFPNALSTRTSLNRTIDSFLSTIDFTYYNSTGVVITQNYENSVSIKSRILSEEVLSGKTNKVDQNTKTKLRNK